MYYGAIVYMNGLLHTAESICRAADGMKACGRLIFVAVCGTNGVEVCLI